MTADDLWNKYSDNRGNGYKTMARHEFYAALAERDEYVKKECAKKIIASGNAYGGYPDRASITEIAAAIAKMEIK